ncbi:MAG TPA: DNA repair protein RadC [Syntrophales bacterium]|nr:DNA repair protein RadC [Syntrophales bacterium]
MKKDTRKPSGIATWSEDDRPREKLFRLGAKHLSDSELLAVILRIGVEGKSAIDLGQEIKARFKTWRNMADVDIAEWKQIKGLGITKISQILAAIEIGQRIQSEKSKQDVLIKDAKQLAEIFLPRMRDEKKESFWVVLLDGKNKIKDEMELAKGTVNEVSTYVREVLMTVLRGAAASFAIIHNHPSGNPEPSNNDLQLTRELVFAGQALKIKVQDHLIIGDDRYYSFAEQNQIKKFEKQWHRYIHTESDGG